DPVARRVGADPARLGVHLGAAAEPARPAPGPASRSQRLPARVARARGDGARVREPGPVRGRAAGRPAARAGSGRADRGGAARARLLVGGDRALEGGGYHRVSTALPAEGLAPPL